MSCQQNKIQDILMRNGCSHVIESDDIPIDNFSSLLEFCKEQKVNINSKQDFFDFIGLPLDDLYHNNDLSITIKPYKNWMLKNDDRIKSISISVHGSKNFELYQVTILPGYKKISLKVNLLYNRRTRDVPRYTGVQAMRNIILGCNKVGIKEIILEAERSPDVIGYYVWPLMGFDGWLDTRPKGVKRSESGYIPKSFKANRIQELFATEKGKEWWKKHGYTVSCTFDLENKEQLLVLHNFLKQRKIIDN